MLIAWPGVVRSVVVVVARSGEMSKSSTSEASDVVVVPPLKLTWEVALRKVTRILLVYPLLVVVVLHLLVLHVLLLCVLLYLQNLLLKLRE